MDYNFRMILGITQCDDICNKLRSACFDTLPDRDLTKNEYSRMCQYK